MSGPHTPKPSPLAGEGAERRRREAGEGAFANHPSPGRSLRSRPPSPASGEGVELAGPKVNKSKSVIRARQLRARMTDAETKLWFALRDRRFANYKFRRQVRIGSYYADFVCFEARVVIEVDGGQHAESASDKSRDQWFATNDFQVLRFWNNEVLRNLEGVLTMLIDALQSRTPHPALRLRSAPPSPARREGVERAVAQVRKPRHLS
jgi:very-short-patch-repair endonuclease